MAYRERTVIKHENQMQVTSSYKNRKKATIRKDIVLITVAFVIAVVTFIAASITVTSRTKGATSDNAAYYQQLEKAYVKEARKIMNGQGYYDAGISMTRRMNEAGERIYTVKVHHSRLTDASSDKANELVELLSNIPFEDGRVLYQII